MNEEIFDRLERVLPGYEKRDSQVRLSRLVAQALRNKQHAALEAPTGVGKSLAYLIGAYEEARRSRVVISTNSLTLQSQLMKKDVPLFNKALNENERVRVAVLKGRSHYVCLERLNFYYDKHKEKEPMYARLWDLANDRIGEDEQYDFLVPSEVWAKVTCDSNTCLRDHCPFFVGCFYYQAKLAATQANFIIVNHHLFLLDRQIRSLSGRALLPDYDFAILDEAHEIQDIASDVFGKRLTLGRVKHLLFDILNYQGRGLLAYWRDIDLFKGSYGLLRDEILELSEDFFSNIKIRAKSLVDRDCFPDSTLLFEKFEALSVLLSELTCETEIESRMLDRTMDRVLELCRDFREIINLEDQDKKVYYAKKQDDRVDLFATPIVVSDLLDYYVWCLPSVICLSATLASGNDFSYFVRETGFRGVTEVFASPFNFREQVCRYITDVPYITSYDEESRKIYEDGIVSEIRRLLIRTGGRTLVLFTNRDMMKRAYEVLKDMRFGTSEIMCQGEQYPRDEMIRIFKEDEQSVILGLDSFWQGIDVKGNALFQVIIVKLPFEHPSDPVVSARTQRYGSQSFIQYSVPKAIIQFKQGFGRLIRSKTDRGILAILDSRVKTTRWGSKFLNAIPLCSELDKDLKPKKV